MAFQGADLTTNLAEDIVDPVEILLGRFDLAFGFAPAGLVFRDPRRFFDEQTPFFRLGGHDFGHLALLNDGVALCPNAAVPEEVVDVLQTNRGLVDQVLRLPRPIEAAADFDFAVMRVVGRGFALGVLETENHLGHPDGRPIRRATENHIFHALAAKPARRLLAHHPTHGVGHIGFPTAVGTDHRRHAIIERECRPIDERLEPLELE